MADYIEREAALADFEQRNRENPSWTPQRVKQLLVRQPAANVAPVMRCEYCTNLGAHLQDGRYSCKKYALPYCRLDDFCSYWGKRNG